MANKYYNGVSLPPLPEVDTATYPNIIVSKDVADQSYILWCITETDIYYYPSEQSLRTIKDATGLIYTATADSTEWTLLDEQITFTAYTAFPISLFEPFFANCNILDMENYTYFLGESVPVEFYWDWSDIEGKVKATQTATDTAELYKISDDVYTYEQLLTVTGYFAVKGTFSFSIAFAPENIDVKRTPVIFMDGIYVCPGDNCTIEEGENQITFPEKGIYSLWMVDGVEYTGGSTGFNFPTVEPTVLYDGEMITDHELDGYAESNNTYLFNDKIALRDILITTFDGEEYVDEVYTSSGVEDFVYNWGSEVDTSPWIPDFSDRPYALGALFLNDEEVDYKEVFLDTPELGTYSVKVIRFLPGSANKIAREVVINTASEITLGIGETVQVAVLSDNASSETPTYTYSCDYSYATISETGLISAVKVGTAYAYVKSDATDNYHDYSQQIKITVQEEATGGAKTTRSITVSADKTSLEVGETVQISVTDNASAESPTYNYSSSNTTIATVDSSGIVTGKSGGTVTITVTSPETTSFASGSGTIEITVNGEVVKTERELSATVEKSELYVGNTTQITVSDNASSDSPSYSYESSDVNVATVDDSGIITAVGKGTATITISSAETTNYTSGTATVQIAVVVLDEIPNEYTFDFTNADWKTLYPDNYSVVDGTTPFYVASTFTYDGKNTLRSGAITHSGTSLTTINFTLLQAGSIEFNYKVSSESNYDWLTITLDGTQIVRKSGTVDWTVFTQELDVGDHVLELKYTKDGSSSSGSDAGAIGYLTIVGMKAPYAKKYLVRHDGTIYTITDSVLSALEVTELTAEVFQTHGLDVVPTWEQISSLTNPEILLWYDTTEDEPTLNMLMTATPPAQTVVSCGIDLSDPTITGVEFVTTECEGEPLFACSFDGGTTWFIHNGTEWAELTDLTTGMGAEYLTAITTDQWTEKVAGIDSFMFRFVLNTVNDKVKNIVVDYTN